MGLLQRALSVLLFSSLSSTQTLDPAGRNVCHSPRQPYTLVCCAGWRQEGNECTTPVCEREHACHGDEVCSHPGVCSCAPGYYGAHCKARCPPEFWAADCRRSCPCHMHGRCHPVTGECTCNPNRWGPLCQQACRCARHGRCHPARGDCTCDEGWWTHTCAKPCQCFNGGAVGAACDQLTGRCQCHRGHWGQKCSLTCNCYLSPCHQSTGVCECQGGWWGSTCDQHCDCDLAHSRCDPLDGKCLCQPGYKGVDCRLPCEAGKYGIGCQMSCGSCKDSQPCAAPDGACAACDPGWNGTRCDRPCPVGYYGEGCQARCPRCRNAEACHPKTGNCGRCDPGWMGPRCDEVCSDRTYGDACRFLCSPCFHGNCHHVTGRCACQPGFMGESCNSSCPSSLYGQNCSSTCDCGEGVSCHPVSGACPSSGRGALLAGVLVPLFLVLLVVCCCCVCCGGGGGSPHGKDRVTVGDGSTLVRMKYHVYNVLANISASLPCISVWTSGLPRVTVAHHDPEVTFNHSFIEPPSSGWVTDGSSFESDEEEGEALYCVPPREDVPAEMGRDFQEMSSKCNMFLDPSAFSSEDMAAGFAIPRTSSIAKSKRPSVSFAEGTRFSPKERRGSAQDLGAPPGPLRGKAKSPWGALVLSSLSTQGGASRSGEAEGSKGAEGEDWIDDKEQENQEFTSEGGDQEDERTLNPGSHAYLQVPGTSEGRHPMYNSVAGKGAQGQGPNSDVQAGVPEKVTTVYVTVGKTGRPASKLESSSEGPVQSMLRRLGSLQRYKEQEGSRPKAKVANGITKPPRRKLGARARVWEQGGPTGEDGEICKLRRKKLTQLNSTLTVASDDSPTSENDTPKRPLSSILKSVQEAALTDSGSVIRDQVPTPLDGAGCGQPVTDPSCLPEASNNKGLEASVKEEPSYENVMVKHS